VRQDNALLTFIAASLRDSTFMAASRLYVHGRFAARRSWPLRGSTFMAASRLDVHGRFAARRSWPLRGSTFMAASRLGLARSTSKTEETLVTRI